MFLIRALTAQVLTCSALLIGLSSTAAASTLLSEGFDSVGSLANSGWVSINKSTPGGSTGWFQGDASVFSAVSGAGNSYIAANYSNAGFGGNVDNWLLTPTMKLTNGTTITFYTRSNGAMPDALKVMLSLNGSSTNTSDFTTTLLSINSVLNSNGYPTEWTKYTITLSGITGEISGRIAFNYAFADTAKHGDYIGIDGVTVVSPGTPITTSVEGVPEPSTAGMLLAGLGAALTASKFRRRLS